jgi:hypothetical protein
MLRVFNRLVLSRIISIIRRLRELKLSGSLQKPSLFQTKQSSTNETISNDTANMNTADTSLTYRLRPEIRSLDGHESKPAKERSFTMFNELLCEPRTIVLELAGTPDKLGLTPVWWGEDLSLTFKYIAVSDRFTKETRYDPRTNTDPADVFNDATSLLATSRKCTSQMGLI